MILLTRKTNIKGYLINNTMHKKEKVYFKVFVENKTLKLTTGNINNYMFVYIPYKNKWAFRKDITDINGYEEYKKEYALMEFIRMLQNKINYILS